MGLFSRIRSFFSTNTDRVRQEIEQEAGDILSEDGALETVWQELDDTLSDENLHQFTIENNGAELFRLGWMGEGDSDEVQAAREAFFDLMEDYSIDRDEFDWDAWRDWYEDS